MRIFVVSQRFSWMEWQGAEDELKDAVGFSRPVSVCFEVVDDFSFYVDGVYTSTNCRDKPEVRGWFRMEELWPAQILESGKNHVICLS